MLRSVAVLSDVHGVDPVLEAVLDEPDVRAADLVVVTGDHAAGPQPVQVLDRLAALGDRVLLVRGNADRELVDLARGEATDAPNEAFADLPDGVRTVVCGHTHMPFVRLVDRRTVVNPGSVGMPHGGPPGSWALPREGRISLGRTAVDVEEVAARVVAASTYPGREAWVGDHLLRPASDIDALDAFGPRDGRGSMPG